jgi:LPS-assembly protein
MIRAPACVAVASVTCAQLENDHGSCESVPVSTPAWRRPAFFLLVLFFALLPVIGRAQPEPSAIEFGGLNQIFSNAPTANFEMQGDVVTATNGFYVKYGDSLLMADSGTFNQKTYEAVADGHVRIESGDQMWIGEHMRYNFKTHQMQSEEYRTGKPPVFVAGSELTGFVDTKKGATNEATARHVYVTTDDVSNPATRVRASRIKIVPGQYVEMWNAVLYMEGVPSFYFPFYRRNLGERQNSFNFMPGYRTTYGPYLLNTYNWFLDNTADGRFRVDYYGKRGPGTGLDINPHLGRWGDPKLKYYYVHDMDPDESTNNLPVNQPISENRQQFYFGYQATPYTNLNAKAMVNWQSDPLVEHDFAEGAYAANPQPNTFVEINKYTENWSLAALTTPRINDFFDQVERLPEAQLTGYRQPILATPVYYQSVSSAGYYDKYFANTNTPVIPPNYAAARADTYQKLLLPWTFFDWLNVVPYTGGRFTYYSDGSGPGGTNVETTRTIFDAGTEVNFKLSRLWSGVTNSALEIDGLRHIIVPSANYVYVRNPSAPSTQLPQFDSLSPSILLLPVQFPDYNDIDAIEGQNLIRFGLRNTFQTKRNGQVDNLFDWNLILDWNLKPNSQTNAIFLQPQKTFSDLYSDLSFKPRTWITFESQLRYDINDGLLNMTFNQIAFTPNDRWSWGVGYFYLNSSFQGTGENYITSTFYYRFTDNWGFRTTQDFDASSGTLQDQFYTLYRDFRSWTGALTFRVENNSSGPKDYTVAFTFSLKANPKYHPGDDTAAPYHLVGQ